jgi:hypothetical protein
MARDVGKLFQFAIHAAEFFFRSPLVRDIRIGAKPTDDPPLIVLNRLDPCEKRPAIQAR